jgi:hypothetical protein
LSHRWLMALRSSLWMKKKPPTRSLRRPLGPASVSLRLGISGMCLSASSLSVPTAVRHDTLHFCQHMQLRLGISRMCLSASSLSVPAAIVRVR